MRQFPQQPGHQLQSVALRYRLPCAWTALRLPAGAGSAYGPVGKRQASADEAENSLPGDADLVRLEAVLLLAREPLNSRKLSQYANLADGTQARTLVRRLNQRYDGTGRAFRVEHVAGGYQLLTRRKFAAWLRRLAHVPGETRLSAPALETLAVIAYRQGVPRADIEAIRGVNCGEILRQLIDRDLIRIGGRSEELGRPYLYSTTKRFQQTFGLTNLDDLPSADTLRNAPLPIAPLALAAEHSPSTIADEYEEQSHESESSESDSSESESSESDSFETEYSEE